MQEILHLVAAAPTGRRPSHRGRTLLAILVLWRARSRSRRRLALLDDRELADVGITRDEQRTECAKPFWRA